jgi:hypothetical protein
MASCGKFSKVNCTISEQKSTGLAPYTSSLSEIHARYFTTLQRFAEYFQGKQFRHGSDNLRVAKWLVNQSITYILLSGSLLIPMPNGFLLRPKISSFDTVRRFHSPGRSRNGCYLARFYWSSQPGRCKVAASAVSYYRLPRLIRRTDTTRAA